MNNSGLYGGAVSTVAGDKDLPRPFPESPRTERCNTCGILNLWWQVHSVSLVTDPPTESVQTILKKSYRFDRATGYREGDVRGAGSIKIALP